MSAANWALHSGVGMMRTARFGACLAGAMTAMAGLSIAPAPAATGGWQTISSPTTTGSQLDAVEFSGSGDGWAAGSTGSSLEDSGLDGLALHWNGQRWSTSSVPAINQSDESLAGISGTSSDAWAAGWQDPYGTVRVHAYLLHWTGSSWSQLTTPDPGVLTAVAERTPSDVWIAGAGLFEHFDGSGWSVVPPPATTGSVVGIAALSADNVWAVGGTPIQGSGYPKHVTPYVAHWNGTSWSSQAVPTPAVSTTLTSISAVGPHDIWAIGDSRVAPTAPFALHYDGTSWTSVTIPGRASGSWLNGVIAGSSNDVWAVGNRDGTLSNGYAVERTFTEHWDGTQWSIVASPNDSDNDNWYSAVAGAANGPVWAVGADGDTLIARHQ